jgi:hypothetical protein
LFVILADLFELDEELSPLLKAVRWPRPGTIRSLWCVPSRAGVRATSRAIRTSRPGLPAFLAPLDELIDTARRRASRRRIGACVRRSAVSASRCE